MYLAAQRLVVRPQAAGAQVEAFGLTADIYRGGVDVGDPAPVGVALGVAYVMTELRCFPA